MTKEERLLELNVQDQLFKAFDKIFDRDWRAFVKGIYDKNDISNLRTFKILAILKGKDFVSDLLKLMGKRNAHACLRLTRKPKGMSLKDSRFKTIPELMINKYPSGSYREGEVFVQIKEDRWVCFVY